MFRVPERTRISEGRKKIKMKDENLSEEWVSEDDEKDVDEIYQSVPYCIKVSDAFLEQLLKCPPDISMDGNPMTEEAKAIIKTKWLRWLRGMYVPLITRGYCAWYFKRIKGTGHFYPVIPPRGSGSVRTVLTKKYEQKFRWYWTDDKQNYDKNVFFTLSEHPPGLDGRLRSPLASLLDDWRTVKIVRQALERVTVVQANQRHIFEYHPAKNHGGDDNMLNLETFGEKIAGSVIADQERMNSFKLQIKKSDLRQALKMADEANRGFQPSQALNSEPSARTWDRETAAFLSRSCDLPPDYSYKAVPSPQVHADLSVLIERLYKSAATLMDMPIQLFETATGRTNATVKGNLMFINSRLQAWAGFFADETRKAFLAAYSVEDQLRRSKATIARNMKLPEEQLEGRVTVYIMCTPIANVEDIHKLWMRGFIKKETAGHHMLEILGIPLDDLKVSEVPDKFPREVFIKEEAKHFRSNNDTKDKGEFD